MGFINRPSILIVGGGPVGLVTGIRILENLPSANVTICERHLKYKRVHNLRILPKNIQDIKSPYLDDIKKGLQSYSAVSTLVLENSLLKAFTSYQGANFVHRKITSLSGYLQSNPTKFDIIIGADGSHSIVQREVFDSKFSIQKDLKYLVELRYEFSAPDGSYSSTRALTPEEMDAVQVRVKDFLLFEHVSKPMEKQGKVVTSVSLWILVGRDIYVNMVGCNFAAPYYVIIDKHRFPDSLERAISIYLNQRCEIEQENHHVIKATCTRLGIYTSHKYSSLLNVSKSENPTSKPIIPYMPIVTLVGDSEGGVPFFRACNNGFIKSRWLVRAICDANNTNPSFLKRVEGRVWTLLAKFLNIQTAPSASHLETPLKVPHQPWCYSHSCFDRYSVSLYVFNRLQSLVARVKACFLTVMSFFLLLRRALLYCNHYFDMVPFLPQQNAYFLETEDLASSPAPTIPSTDPIGRRVIGKLFSNNPPFQHLKRKEFARS